MPIYPLRKLQGFSSGNKGFSLVEMSIVIVIIALLVSAVMKGRSLIDEAKMRAIVSEVTQHKLALNSFYAKYNQYPGDFNQAVANWTNATPTQNGDNNGRIEFKNTAGTPVYEGYRAWEHLSYARMVNNTYLGTQTTSAAAVETDVPLSKSGGGYLLDYSSSATAYDGTTANTYGLREKNIMLLGMPVATTVSPVLASGILTPPQAMSIDTKMDDGIPTKGTMRGADGNGATAGNCITGDIYTISLEGKDCIMIFKATN